MAYKNQVPTWTQQEIDALKQFVRDQFIAEGFPEQDIITIQATGSRVYNAFDPAIPTHVETSDLDVIAWLPAAHTSGDRKVYAPMWTPEGEDGIHLSVQIRLRFSPDGSTTQGPVRDDIRPEGFVFPLYDLYSRTFVEGSKQDAIDWTNIKIARRARGKESPAAMIGRLRHRVRKLEKQTTDLETRVVALEGGP